MPLYQVFDMLSPLAAGAEVAVTGATTALIDRWHKISGTSADYTITLPAAAGLGGRFIGFRVLGAAAASKFYTLDGNSGETIDGATTRVLWAEETAVLLCDGSNWFKVAGKPRPMVCQMYLNNQVGPLANAAVTQVPIDDTGVDNTGAMANEGSNRIDIKRTGLYVVKAGLAFNGNAGASLATAIGRAIVIGQVNTGPATVAQGEGHGHVGGYAIAVAIAPVNLTAGENLTLHYYQDGGATDQYLGGSAGYVDIETLNCTEVPSW
jgi:hypothetical protein